MADRLTIEVGKGEAVSALVYRAEDPRRDATLVLAHGAGAPQQSRFMVRFAIGLAARGLDVVTFNFLYMEQRRKTPDRTEKLEACYRAVIVSARRQEGLEGNALFAGGKSMGGRIASHLAAAEGEVRLKPDPTNAPDAAPDSRGVRLQADQFISGLVLLGYPLHPPGKPEQLRSAHLPRIRCPMLFVQGSRDPFGAPDELRPILEPLAALATLHVVDNGDHSLAPKRSGDSVDAVYEAVMDRVVRWIDEVHQSR